MKRTIQMDDLIDRVSEPFASFHDATLCKVSIDYEQKTLTAEFELCVGNPEGARGDERHRTRRAQLNLLGLVLWAVEAPQNREASEWGPPWLVYDCIMDDATTERGREFAKTLGPDVYAWCMYFGDINAFGYCAAKEAIFEWR